ncbi:MAG: aminoacyl-tRNA hydrolase [Acidobacteria bacterium]|nr:MAG: aminoacyl-tRNA hydrolase [Acidobacteriota bacterium]
MFLVTGLGNPGPQYCFNRHNAGFMLVDRLADQAGARFERTFKRSVSCTTDWCGREVLLIKPLTYMNRSGGAVAEVLDRFGFSLDCLLVAYDEVSLPLGKIRFRRSGSSGGHRGMQSIIDVLGTQEIPRVRLGVGAGEPPEDYPDYVLSNFSKAELVVVDSVLDRAGQAMNCWVCEGIEKTMAKFNG